MNRMDYIFSIMGGIIVVLGFLGGVIVFLMKLGAEIAVHKKRLEDTCHEVETVNGVIRTIIPVIQEHTTDIAVLKTDIGYIRNGIDDVRGILREKL